jgi:hypothetical protein
MLRTALAALSLAAAPALAVPALAFTAEPLPAPLPALIDDGWQLLGKVRIEETQEGELWKVVKTFDPALAARNGTELTLTGYAIPLSARDPITRLILVSDPADCPFCGGGYGPAIEVLLDLGLPRIPEFAMLRVTGRLELIEDPETMQAYRLTDARAEIAP